MQFSTTCETLNHMPSNSDGMGWVMGQNTSCSLHDICDRLWENSAKVITFEMKSRKTWKKVIFLYF
jgi:hypothetical protein